MKNLNLLCAFALTASVFAGCSEEEMVEYSAQPDNALKATAESFIPESRVGFEGSTGNFYWSQGDILNVALNTKADKKFSTFAQFQHTNGAGKPRADFSGLKLADEEIGQYAIPT